MCKPATATYYVSLSSLNLTDTDASEDPEKASTVFCSCVALQMPSTPSKNNQAVIELLCHETETV